MEIHDENSSTLSGLNSRIGLFLWRGESTRIGLYEMESGMGLP
jgi:hypothetical protein